MARLPRLALAGYPHHLIQRGADRMTVFPTADEHARYLADLHELAAAHRVAIHAYVLMNNHVHLLATPATGEALPALMQALGRRYVRWFNDRHQRTGPLWDGRYRSAVIEADRYLLACSRYIENNPVRAGIVAAPAEYRWSSYRHHVGLEVDPLVTDHALVWGLGNTPFERQVAYQKLFERPLPATEIEQLRVRTNRGKAIGGSLFLRTIGDRHPFAVSARSRGRPYKA